MAEARAGSRGAVEPEHVLLAIIAEGTGVAFNVLRHVGVGEAGFAWLRVPPLAERPPGARRAWWPRWPRYSPRTDELLRHAAREASELLHGYLGTEHLLLGVLREGGAAARSLDDAGASYDVVRAGVVDFLWGSDDEGSRDADVRTDA